MGMEGISCFMLSSASTLLAIVKLATIDAGSMHQLPLHGQCDGTRICSAMWGSSKTLLLESAMISCHCSQLEASSNPHRQERMKEHLETDKLSVPNLTSHPLHPACICIARAPHAVSKNEKDALEFACFPWRSHY